MNELKPATHLRVYDLVREAGLDVSDWSNYRRSKSPASNPNYCYEWAFEAPDRVVLCLWYEEMEHEGAQVFQRLNFQTTRPEHRHWSASQRARAERMDHTIRLANIKRLPVRVIVVDGSRRGNDEEAASKVERRLLDPVSWFVASYDDDGNCRLQRSALIHLEDSSAADEALRIRKITRIAFNSSEWRRPTGDASEQESDETYNAQNRFGHEDWLFRGEWVIDGWRYAFLQGLNKSRRTYVGQSLDVTLFTIQPDKRRRLVATIYGLESLSDEQANDALEVFREKGWLKIMQDEVRAVDGNPDALGAPKWAEHVLNVRFRLDNVDPFPPGTILPDDESMRRRHRYMLYEFDHADRERVEKNLSGRAGTQEPPEAGRLFRRGTKPVEYTPEHNRMQAKLLAELQKEYGRDHVCLEKDFVDAQVENEKELIFFEIKSDLDPRAVIRQALGQILEYAYHPARTGRRPDSLVIVGRTELRSADEAYLKCLGGDFNLPLTYRVVTI